MKFISLAEASQKPEGEKIMDFFGTGKKAAAALIGLGLASAALAASTISFFVTDPKSAKYDLGARVPADALFFKGYDSTIYTDGIYYQFDSDNGYDFYCHFVLADVGIMKQYLVDYKLHQPDGKYKVFGGRFDSDDCSLAADRYEWRIGPNSIQGDMSAHRLRIASEPLRVDVTLKTLVPFYQVGDHGMIYVEPDRKKSGQLTYFPLFAAEGTIKDGGTVIKISGWGYGNRMTENFLFTDLTSLHTALRWQKDGLGFDLHDYQLRPEWGGGLLKILMVYNQGKLCHVSQSYDKKNLEFIIEKKTGLSVPTDYRVISKAPGIEAVIEFREVKLSDYNDPLIWLGSVEKYFLSLVSPPPLDLRFDGRVKITITTPDGSITEEGPGHGLALLSQGQ